MFGFPHNVFAKNRIFLCTTSFNEWPSVSVEFCRRAFRVSSVMQAVCCSFAATSSLFSNLTLFSRLSESSLDDPLSVTHGTLARAVNNGPNSTPATNTAHKVPARKKLIRHVERDFDLRAVKTSLFMTKFGFCTFTYWLCCVVFKVLCLFYIISWSGYEIERASYLFQLSKWRAYLMTMDSAVFGAVACYLAAKCTKS